MPADERDVLEDPQPEGDERDQVEVQPEAIPHEREEHRHDRVHHESADEYPVVVGPFQLGSLAKRAIEEVKGKVLKATILTHSLETSLADQFKGSAPTLLIANTLRRLGQGIKVCCEIVMEAVDAGLIPEGEEVVAVGGTARGWDTVAIIKSAASKRFMQLSVLEIWGKPRV